MIITPIILTLVFLANFFSGVFILLRNYKNILYQSFALFAFGFAGWALAILVTIYLSPSLLWGRLSLSFGSLMITGFLSFSIIFILKETYRRFILPIVLLGSIFFILSFTDFLIKTVAVDTVNKFISGEWGSLLSFFNAWVVTSVLISLFLLFRGYFRSVGRKRDQLKYVFIGFALFSIPAAFTNVIFPNIYGIYNYNSLGPAFSVFLIASIAYAIARYHLFDINWVIERAVVFSLLVSSLVLVFTFFVSALTIIMPGIFSIVLASIIITLSFGPFKNLVDKILDRLIFRGEYEYKKTLEELTHIWGSTLKLDQLLKSILEKISHYFGNEKAAFAILVKQDHFIPKQVIGLGEEFFELTHDNQLVKAFSKNSELIIDRGELEHLIKHGDPDIKNQLIKNEMEKLGFELAIGLVSHGKLIGIMLLGKKKDKSAFTIQDLQLLGIISREASDAVEKGRVFEEAKFLDQAKYEFIKVVSSQFRAQLSQIRWQSEFLKSSLKKPGSVTPMDKQSADDIFVSTIILINVLNNIFDALSIGSNEVKIEKTRERISHAVKDVFERMKNQFEDKKLAIDLAISEEADDKEIYFDSQKIKRVIEILLENVLRYTHKGGVKINVSIAEVEEKPMVQVSVEDSGIGILEDDFPRIFEKFYRAQNAILAHPEGIGLGLYIAKHFISLHEGKIWAESEGEMNGATFYFALPV